MTKKNTNNNQEMIIILLAPSGAGKDTVIDHLNKRGIAEPVMRHTTRDPRKFDKGVYGYVSNHEFVSRLKQNEYLLPNYYANNYFGIPVSEVKAVLKRGKIPVLKGMIFDVQKAKTEINKLNNEVKVLTLYMETHPQDHWKVVLKERKENSMAERISESQKELVAATESHKHLVDYFIVNDHNDIEKVIKEISSIIKKHSN